MVPEPDDANPLLFQESATPVIAEPDFFIIVLPAIKLNRQLALVAVEIKNVPADRVLAAKFLAGKSTASQYSPQQLFGIGVVAAQVSGISEDVGWGAQCFSLTPNPSPRGRGARIWQWLHGMTIRNLSDVAEGDHTSSSNRAGSSIASFTQTRNCTASRPSMMRWS